MENSRDPAVLEEVAIEDAATMILVVNEESHRQFVSGFRGNDIPVSRFQVNDGEDRGLSPSYDPRPRVAIQSSSDVHFVDFNGIDEVEVRCVECSGESLY